MFSTKFPLSGVSRAVRMVTTTAPEAEMAPIEQAKKRAAYACGEKYVHSGCRLGVGSGSTVKYLVEYLKQGYQNGQLKDIICVPTSFLTKQWLIESGLPVSDLDSHPELDVCIDGADEVDGQFTCIKGGGACLAQEKIVQTAAKHFYVIADYLKDSKHLGDRYPAVPIEVLPPASQPLLLSIPRAEGGSCQLRQATKKCGPVVTDNGNFIIDWQFEKNVSGRDWLAIQQRLANTPGIVETGLFIGCVDAVFFAYSDGSVKEIVNAKKH
ncbi:CRE-RPIA-1 protein [Caenorhabditis remanei]|uniref:ribose-5-phosphate isomerase n=1 Tax=Caenorhabditis remanei TaxID=31234 RepID=E3LSU4_CAERE|nr:CRE-RPIA-1 protein [Caenorhabditis remanei]